SDYARRVDHVFHCQRRREVLCHHPCDVPRHLSAARRTEHHGAADTSIGDSVRRDLQRADHRGAGTARAARHHVPARRGSLAAASEPCDLWSWWNHRAVHRHQDHRRHHHGAASGIGGPEGPPMLPSRYIMNITRNLIAAVLMTIVTTVILGII